MNDTHTTERDGTELFGHVLASHNGHSPHVEALRTRLAAAADDADLLDIAYRIVDSPVGRLLLAATRTGLVRVAFEKQGFDDSLTTLATRLSPRILEAPTRLDDAARELDEYFAGSRTRFDLRLDRSLSHGFRLQVHEHLPQIAYGSTESYADVAREVGSPRAVRAVGTACAVNPLPIVVPCHRVLRSDGSMGGYAGGAEAKTLLLEFERAHAVTADR